MRVEYVRLRIEQLAIHVVRDRSRHSREFLVTARLVRVAVCSQAHRIVVAELFEVRHAPLRIGRITVKPSAQLIEYSAGANFSERVERHSGEIRMPKESMRERELDRWKIVESRSPGQISCREKQRSLRSCETRQRPSARTSQMRGCVLIIAIDIRTLVGIDFHRHEISIQLRRDFGIGVSRLIHHMAPVTPHRANIDEDRTIQRTRECERLRPPTLPSNRACRGLAKIKARLRPKRMRWDRVLGLVRERLR